MTAQQPAKTNIKANSDPNALYPASSFQGDQKILWVDFAADDWHSPLGFFTADFSIDFNRFILDMGVCFMPATGEH